jgi:DNA-binding HxlR family transcriptional regulator
MQHKGFDTMPCPIARSLERVGEWWSILILRDAFKGVSRFDQFQKSLGIAPNMLTRRLNTLVESGLLERRLYSEKPPRHEYVLTPRGRDFRPVLWALMAWGNKHFPPEGQTVTVVDAETGEQVDPVLIDSRSGRVLRGPEFTVATVPVAGAAKQRQSVGASGEHMTRHAKHKKSGISS